MRRAKRLPVTARLLATPPGLRYTTTKYVNGAAETAARPPSGIKPGAVAAEPAPSGDTLWRGVGGGNPAATPPSGPGDAADANSGYGHTGIIPLEPLVSAVRALRRLLLGPPPAVPGHRAARGDTPVSPPRPGSAAASYGVSSGGHSGSAPSSRPDAALAQQVAAHQQGSGAPAAAPRHAGLDSHLHTGGGPDLPPLPRAPGAGLHQHGAGGGADADPYAGVHVLHAGGQPKPPPHPQRQPAAAAAGNARHFSAAAAGGSSPSGARRGRKAAGEAAASAPQSQPRAEEGGGEEGGPHPRASAAVAARHRAQEEEESFFMKGGVGGGAQASTAAAVPAAKEPCSIPWGFGTPGCASEDADLAASREGYESPNTLEAWGWAWGLGTGGGETACPPCVPFTAAEADASKRGTAYFKDEREEARGGTVAHPKRRSKKAGGVAGGQGASASAQQQPFHKPPPAAAAAGAAPHYASHTTVIDEEFDVSATATSASRSATGGARGVAPVSEWQERETARLVERDIEEVDASHVAGGATTQQVEDLEFEEEFSMSARHSETRGEAPPPSQHAAATEAGAPHPSHSHHLPQPHHVLLPSVPAEARRSGVLDYAMEEDEPYVAAEADRSKQGTATFVPGSALESRHSHPAHQVPGGGYGEPPHPPPKHAASGSAHEHHSGHHPEPAAAPSKKASSHGPRLAPSSSGGGSSGSAAQPARGFATSSFLPMRLYGLGVWQHESLWGSSGVSLAAPGAGLGPGVIGGGTRLVGSVAGGGKKGDQVVVPPETLKTTVHEASSSAAPRAAGPGTPIAAATAAAGEAAQPAVQPLATASESDLAADLHAHASGPYGETFITDPVAVYVDTPAEVARAEALYQSGVQTPATDDSVSLAQDLHARAGNYEESGITDPLELQAEAEAVQAAAATVAQWETPSARSAAAGPPFPEPPPNSPADLAAHAGYWAETGVTNPEEVMPSMQKPTSGVNVTGGGSSASAAQGARPTSGGGPGGPVRRMLHEAASSSTGAASAGSNPPTGRVPVPGGREDPTLADTEGEVGELPPLHRWDRTRFSMEQESERNRYLEDVFGGDSGAYAGVDAPFARGPAEAAPVLPPAAPASGPSSSPQPTSRKPGSGSGSSSGGSARQMSSAAPVRGGGGSASWKPTPPPLPCPPVSTEPQLGWERLGAPPLPAATAVPDPGLDGAGEEAGEVGEGSAAHEEEVDEGKAAAAVLRQWESAGGPGWAWSHAAPPSEAGPPKQPGEGSSSAATQRADPELSPWEDDAVPDHPAGGAAAAAPASTSSTSGERTGNLGRWASFSLW